MQYALPLIVLFSDFSNRTKKETETNSLSMPSAVRYYCDIVIIRFDGKANNNKI